MTKSILFASFPPTSDTDVDLAPHFAGVYVAGVAMGRELRGRFPEATLLEIARDTTHEELVHYLAHVFLPEPGSRWDFFAEPTTSDLRAITKRLLYVPRLGKSIDLDAVASQLQSGEALEAQQYYESLQPPKIPGVQALWAERGKVITQRLQPLIDELTASVVELCERWLLKPPVEGFRTDDFWSMENLELIAQEGTTIADEELNRYFLGWFLGITAGPCTGGCNGRLMFLPTPLAPSYPALELLIYVPEYNIMTNPTLFSALRGSKQAPKLWWERMHPA